MTKLIPPTPMIEQYLEERRNYRVAMIAREPYAKEHLDEIQFDMSTEMNKMYSTEEVKCKS